MCVMSEGSRNTFQKLQQKITTHLIKKKHYPGDQWRRLMNHERLSLKTRIRIGKTLRCLCTFSEYKHR